MSRKRVKQGTSRASSEHRRVLFVNAMIETNGNQTQSAIAAGFPAKSAHVRGAELVKDRKVLAMLEIRRAEAIEKAKCDADEVLMSRARVIRFDPRKLVDDKGKAKKLHELDDETALALEAIEMDGVKVRVDRSGAANQLMKHHGLFEKDNKQLPRPSTVLHMPGVKSVKFEPLRGRKPAA